MADTGVADSADSADFGPFDGRAWLNAAHQGPLPRVAVEAVARALAWKIAPHRLTDELFAAVPARLRTLLGELLAVPADEVVLGNSTSYGLHLLANGLPLHPGDEILLVAGDFPATILPWLGLAERGVVVRQVRPRAMVFDGADLERHLTSATKVFCASWVNSFTGEAVDIAEVGAACRANGTLFVLNGTQGIGARHLDLKAAPVDAIVGCGFKWLCGPYGTGFCWMRPDLLASLAYNQAYWLAAQQGGDLVLNREGGLRPCPADLGARAYDVFGTANFLNFVPWAAALGYLLERGIEAIAAYDQGLVDRLVAGLEGGGYQMVSPRSGMRRSTLVVVSHPDPERNSDLHAALRWAGVDAALRDGNLRFSPHLYNTEADIDRALDVVVDRRG